jgi:pilus assembly protein Flp/PilA
MWNRRDQVGASLVEYALLLALIAVVAIVALHFLGGSVSNTLNSVGSSISNP